MTRVECPGCKGLVLFLEPIAAADFEGAATEHDPACHVAGALLDLAAELRRAAAEAFEPAAAVEELVQLVPDPAAPAGASPGWKP